MASLSTIHRSFFVCVIGGLCVLSAHGVRIEDETFEPVVGVAVRDTNGQPREERTVVPAPTMRIAVRRTSEPPPVLNELIDRKQMSLFCTILNNPSFADVNRKDKNGQAPLHVAVIEQCLGMVKELCQYEQRQGTDVVDWGSTDCIGNTALHYAIVGESDDLCKYVITLVKEKDPKLLNTKNNGGYTPLLRAVMRAKSNRLHGNKFNRRCAWLLAENADPNLRNKECSPLGAAIANDNAYMIQLLLNHNADPNCDDVRKHLAGLGFLKS